jgi:hypothetical protein
MARPELAWLAGLLECNGSLLMSPHQKKNQEYRYIKLTIDLPDLDVAERAAALLGGNSPFVLHPERKRPGGQLYRMQVTGQEAAVLLQGMLPWLGQRKGDAARRLLAEYEQQVERLRAGRAYAEAAARRQRRPDGTFAGGAA